MEVELIEDDAESPSDVHARPRPRRMTAAMVSAFALLAVGFVAGRSSTPTHVAPPSDPTEPAITDVSFIKTSSGLILGLDEPVLDSPVTAGAISLRDSAELWAADQTSLLTDAERALLRDPRGRLTITLDAATGRPSSVNTVDEPEPDVTYTYVRPGPVAPFGDDR